MTAARKPARAPDWNALYATAAAQAGHFTLAQAQECGYSSQLLHKHLARKRIERVRRGIYRLVHFPISEHEELVVLWLWSDREGVFSHETSLALHDLSDALPASVHMTVPEDWRSRRLRIPDGLVLHHGNLAAKDRAWHEVVPLTAPYRVLFECIEARVPSDWIEQGLRQARDRGLLSGREAERLSKRLGQSRRETR